MIYLDHAASTPVSEGALKAAMPFIERCANPSSIHAEGRQARLAIIDSRERCAHAIGADPSEIFFTSGGTESDNWAIFSAAYSSPAKRHIVTTEIEHKAVLNTCAELSRRGFDITYVAPDKDGIVSVDSIRSVLRPDTALVSVMTANNEIGTIQPVSEIGALCREKGILFHTDAVQAAGHLQIDVNTFNSDLLSVSAHKLGGLQGCGFLYVRKGLALSPLVFGGGQEKGMRSGTENTAAIVAMGAAFEECVQTMKERNRYISDLRDELAELLMEIPFSRINGSMANRLCSNLNISFDGIEGESLVLNLDLAGICASSGSACAGETGERSHVLKAIEASEEQIKGSLRLSLSHHNTREDILLTAKAVREIVQNLREMTGFSME